MEQKRLVLALVLSAAILFGWSYLQQGFFPTQPQRQNNANTSMAQQEAAAQQFPSPKINSATTNQQPPPTEIVISAPQAVVNDSIALPLPVLTLLFIVACPLIFYFRKEQRRIEAEGPRKGVYYYFLKNSLEFLIPFTLVILFFHVLLWVTVYLASAYISLQSLIQFEEFLTKTKSFFSEHLKLSAGKVFFIFLLLYLVGMLRVFAQTAKRLFPLFDKYQLWSKRVYVVLVLLCSFTLFGNQLGEASREDLKVHIKTVREGYAEARKQARNTLSQEVASRVFDKIYATFPSSYQKGLTYPEQFGGKAGSLLDYYKKAQSEHGVTSSRAESVFAEAASRYRDLSTLNTEIVIPDEATRNETDLAESVPSQVSQHEVEIAQTAITQYRRNLGITVITFLKTEGGKKLSLQLPKILSGQLKSELFSPWIKVYPIVGPIVDIFVGTIDDQVKTKLEKMIDASADRSIEKPDNIQNAINEEATRIVDQVAISIPPETLEKADQAGRQLENELANIDQAHLQIDSEIQRIEDSRIENMIAQMRSSDEDIRENASKGLSQIGDKLSESQVNKIISIMRYGKQRWSKFLYREGHCDYYEYISIKYYAANALESMKSPYISSEIKSEATTCTVECKSTERITDPGWI